MTRQILISIFILLMLSSCNVLQKTAKQELSDGYYIKKTISEKSKVYVDVVDDNIYIHPSIERDNQTFVDTLSNSELYQKEVKAQENVDFKLSQNSFDLDFLTIPLKFRTAEKGVPAQLNADINGAIYLGYRTDVYHIKYAQNPLKKSIRKIQHFGYSLGFFTGFGNTTISPTNTQEILQKEYDGVVWSKGIAGIIGINNFTVGLTIGFEHLLDKNRSIWIYEQKTWFGLGFGLNLN